MIEYAYLISGLILPLFYLPQIFKLRNDSSLLASYSLSKSTAQFILRLPTLAFAYFIVASPFMNVVLAADVIGRGVELVVAARSMDRQGVSAKGILERMFAVPFFRAAWRQAGFRFTTAFAKPDFQQSEQM